MEKQYVELLFVYLGMMLIAGSALVWAIFVRDFIRKHGGKPSFALFNWSPVFDYRKARLIAKKTGRVPWFLRLFEAMLTAAFLIVIILMVRLVIEFGRCPTGCPAQAVTKEISPRRNGVSPH